jgi:cytochrome d ubiquinol oxidase subunit II
MIAMGHHLLADIWFWLIGFILILYVVLDGFDLGAGMLFLWTRDERRRGFIIGSLGYTWHANQTWLVVLGGLLFGAFPLVYGVVLSALYIPIGLMLLGLIFRGVSFEFREEAHSKVFWNWAFGGGSLLAALAQGFVLGGVLSGLHMAGDTYAGGVWDWLNPFTLLVSLGLVFGYLQLGATYLIIKTEPEIHDYFRKQASVAAFLSLFIILGAVIWSSQITPFFVHKWISWPGLLATSFPFLLALLTYFLLLNTLRTGKSETAPFIQAILIFVFSFISLAGSLHPYILPPQVTVDAAAAPALTLKVMLVVMVPLLPVMLLYNAYQCKVFSGKASEAGYGE